MSAGAMEFFKVHILGLNAESLRKLLLSLAVVAIVVLLRAGLRAAVTLGPSEATRRSIWFRKNLRLVLSAIAVLLILSIWFDDPHRFATFAGLLAGGIAFASQNVMLSIAGYFVIVFGKVFDLGERVEFGGVRGDVLDVDLIKTTIMEMGVPPELPPDEQHWVAGRQYTGRVVTVANSVIFQRPIFNYTRTFNFIWEELRVPVRYGINLQQAQEILIEVATRNTSDLIAKAETQLDAMRRIYLIQLSDLQPSVYVRLTDNWIELSVRFLAMTYGVRDLKSRMSCEILERFRQANIEVASSTIELVHWPKVELEQGA